MLLTKLVRASRLPAFQSGTLPTILQATILQATILLLIYKHWPVRLCVAASLLVCMKSL